MMKRIVTLVFGLSLSLSATAGDLKKVSFRDVEITDQFWRSKQEAVIKAGIPHEVHVCEQQHAYVQNLVSAGKKNRGEKHDRHKGFYWDDYFAHRCVQDMAYALSLNTRGNKDLVAAQKLCRDKLEAWIPLYQAAQEKDGYLDTYFTLTGQPRFKHLGKKHEFFLMGAMIEAATAHYRATNGKDSRLLKVAIKCADYLCATVNPKGIKVASGHPGIEHALIELAEIVNERDGAGSGAKYVKLVQRLIDTKGDVKGRYDIPLMRHGKNYSLEHRPFVQQEHAVGHVVRSAYLYTAAADVARLTGHAEYQAALDRIWKSAVQRRMYITGGAGVNRGEAYGADYELPASRKDKVYQESCASAGTAIWQHRMMLLHGDAKYADVMERTLYNALPAGISLKGDRFFYVNPLASEGADRWAWHKCACCPGNIMQMILRVGDYVYARTDKAIYLNLFVASKASITVGNNKVKLIQKTDYPWDGRVTVTVSPQRRSTFALNIRIPGWAQNRPVPGDLYRFAKESTSSVSLSVNGRPVALRIEKGYAVIRRKWAVGDKVAITMPMPIRRVIANEKAQHLTGRTALQRGPIVYCAEGVDNGGNVLTITLADTMKLTSKHRNELLNGVTVLTAALSGGKPFTAIPYYTWANRGKSEMSVWFVRLSATD